MSKHIRDNKTTKDELRSSRDLKDILARLREAESSRPLHKLSDRVDQHMMLSALDVAERTERLAPFLDARSMAFATGVEEKYSGASLKRLSTVTSPQGGTQLVNMNTTFKLKRHPRQAYIYCINPVFPLVWSFCTPRQGKTLPRSAAGEPRLFGTWGVYVIPSLREAWSTQVVADSSETLITFFQSQVDQYQAEGNKTDLCSQTDLCSRTDLCNLCRMTTQAVTRTGLLIGRTNLGVALGKPAVAVYLTFGDNWQTVRDIAARTGMERSYVSRILTKTLAPMGLVKSSMTEYVGSGQRQLWHAGMHIEDYAGNLPDIVGARLRRWEADRDRRKLEYPVTQEERRAARKHRNLCKTTTQEVKA